MPPFLVLALRMLRIRLVKYAVLSFLLLVAPVVCRATDDSAVLDELNLARTHPQQYAGIVDGCMRDLPGADPRCVAEAAASARAVAIRLRPDDECAGTG